MDCTRWRTGEKDGPSSRQRSQHPQDIVNASGRESEQFAMGFDDGGDATKPMTNLVVVDTYVSLDLNI